MRASNLPERGWTEPESSCHARLVLLSVPHTRRSLAMSFCAIGTAGLTYPKRLLVPLRPHSPSIENEDWPFGPSGSRRARSGMRIREGPDHQYATRMRHCFIRTRMSYYVSIHPTHEWLPASLERFPSMTCVASRAWHARTVTHSICLPVRGGGDQYRHSMTARPLVHARMAAALTPASFVHLSCRTAPARRTSRCPCGAGAAGGRGIRTWKAEGNLAMRSCRTRTPRRRWSHDLGLRPWASSERGLLTSPGRRCLTLNMSIPRRR